MSRECPFGKERSPITNRCVKKCQDDTERNENGRCIKKCPEGKIRNPQTGRCVNPRKSARKSAKKSAQPRPRKSAKKSAQPRPRKSAKKSAQPRPRKSARKSAQPRPRKSARKAAKKSAQPPPRKSARKSAQQPPRKEALPRAAFSTLPLFPNQVTFDEYIAFQEYIEFTKSNPTKVKIDLDLRTLTDIKPFYRIAQRNLHPDTNGGKQFELYIKIQNLFDKRYNPHKEQQGYDLTWRKA